MSTIDSVVGWCTANGPSERARTTITALRRLGAYVWQGDPQSAQWLHDNLAEVVERMRVKEPEISAATLSTYESRVRACLEAFLAGDDFRPGVPRRNPKEAASVVIGNCVLSPAGPITALDAYRAYLWLLSQATDFDGSVPVALGGKRTK